MQGLGDRIRTLLESWKSVEVLSLHERVSRVCASVMLSLSPCLRRLVSVCVCLVSRSTTQFTVTLYPSMSGAKPVSCVFVPLSPLSPAALSLQAAISRLGVLQDRTHRARIQE
jgi:hypothetical protein